jgi:hypothetical protein
MDTANRRNDTHTDVSTSASSVGRPSGASSDHKPLYDNDRRCWKHPFAVWFKE